MYVRTFTLDEKRERVRNCQRIQENDCAKKFCCNSDSCNWLSDISMISMLLRLEPEKTWVSFTRQNKQIREFNTQQRNVTRVRCAVCETATRDGICMEKCVAESGVCVCARL